MLKIRTDDTVHLSRIIDEIDRIDCAAVTEAVIVLRTGKEVPE